MRKPRKHRKGFLGWETDKHAFDRAEGVGVGRVRHVHAAYIQPKQKHIYPALSWVLPHNSEEKGQVYMWSRRPKRFGRRGRGGRYRNDGTVRCNIEERWLATKTKCSLNAKGWSGQVGFVHLVQPNRVWDYYQLHRVRWMDSMVNSEAYRANGVSKLTRRMDDKRVNGF